MTQAPHTPESNDTTGGEVPNPHTGAGIGATGEPDTMEPEEDPDPAETPAE
ncbi:MAG: hypothetical protein ABJA16_13190 [Nakamurella sp.]